MSFRKCHRLMRSKRACGSDPDTFTTQSTQTPAIFTTSPRRGWKGLGQSGGGDSAEGREEETRDIRVGPTGFSVERKGEITSAECVPRGRDSAGARERDEERKEEWETGANGTDMEERESWDWQHFMLRYAATRDRYAIWFEKEWTDNLGTLSPSLFPRNS